MAASESMKKASRKYDEKFDVIRFRVPRGQRDKIKEFAESQGESINQMLNRLIKEEAEKKGWIF